jgi:M6 family metalloprotease-like protein
MKRSFLLLLTIFVAGCSQPQSDVDIQDSTYSSAYQVPAIPENSDHGYLLEDNRIPTIYSCEEWVAFWDQLGPAVSFEVADQFPNFLIAVSTEVFLKNRHLDSDGDGVICFFEHGVAIESGPQEEVAITGSELQEPSVPLTPAQDLNALEECKIPQGGKWPTQTTRAGFPAHPDYQLETGDQIVIQLVNVEAEDMPANGYPEADQAFFLRTKSFLEDVTEGKIDFEIRSSDFVSKLPRKIIDYGLIRSGPVLLHDFVQDAISTADEFIDFSDVDIVVVVPPSNVSALQVEFSPALPMDRASAFSTQEGKVYRATLVGQDMRWEEGHLLLAHEIGHLLGLQDYYSFEFKPGDQYHDQFKFLGEFDNMNFAPGKAREWTGWSRFLLGVLDDDQVRCVTSQKDTSHQLFPIGLDTEEPKMVVIPTGDYTAVVIESRRSMRHDAGLPKENEGLLVYRLDTERESGYGPLEIVRKDNLTDLFLLDAPLRPGESLVVDGLTIKNLESSSTWDVVQVIQN